MIIVLITELMRIFYRILHMQGLAHSKSSVSITPALVLCLLLDSVLKELIVWWTINWNTELEHEKISDTGHFSIKLFVVAKKNTEFTQN